MKEQNVGKILNFFQKFSEFESIGNMALKTSANGQENKRQIKAEDVIITPEGVIIKVDRVMANYVMNVVSPVIKAKEDDQFIDTNKLLIALALTKIYFEEKDQWLYLPLISVEASKEQLQTGQIFLPWATELIINDPAIRAFFDNFYEENGDEEVEYISKTMGELSERQDNLEIFLYETYSKLKLTRNEFDLTFPIFNSGKSTIFMFFNKKDDIVLRREYASIAKEPSKLVEQYLTKFSENVQPEFSKEIWYGTLTEHYPLAAGQCLAIQKNQEDQKIIPVIGGPGTGKTTLFLSLIANEVTKRAINLVAGEEDYSNLMLVTSTSNKAVENVYSFLKRGFKQGFVYVGGNTDNKAMSQVEVMNYIKYLSDKVYNKEAQEVHAAKIKKIQKTIKEKEIQFAKVKSMNLPFKKASELQEYIDSHIVVEIKLNKADEYLLTRILPIEKTINMLPEADFFEQKTKKGLFGLFGGDEKIVDEFNLKFNLKLNMSEIHEICGILKKYTKHDIEVYLDSKILENSKEALTMSEKFLNGILKSDSFTEYFRTNLFGMNYDLYIASLNYMSQETYKHRTEVLKAVMFYIDENPYRYISENYGKNHAKFLRFLSMAYPVNTSTLAAVNGMFSSLKKNVFNLVLADEAGMIAEHSILPALNRARRAIIVGDPKQLEPIISIEDIFLDSLKEKYDEDFWKAYSPSECSAFHRAAGTSEGGFKATGCGIVLDEHRRCAPKIAKVFIDIAEYEGLNVRTPTPKGDAITKIGENLMFFDVKNSETFSNAKVNMNEVSYINKIIQRLFAVGYTPNDIGIITPYKNQERVLIDTFGNILNHQPTNSKIGTVHKFQGIEFKVIIFSSVISREQDTLNFINNTPSMINVALSRAQELFIVTGDFDKLTQDSKYENYIGRMCKAIEKNGKLIRKAS